MSTVPRKGTDAIPWCLAHITPWNDNAVALKLDSADVAELASLTAVAQQSRTDLDAAEDAYRSAVASYNQAVKDMRTLASGQVAIIRATARNSDDPTSIYTLGAIPAPADPQPAPAPGTATSFKVELLQGGAITLRFRCPNPPRTGPVTYRVERQVASQSPFTFFVNAKERTFTDASIPPGTAQVVYRITAQTSTKDGNPAVFGVQFGAGNQATVFEMPPDAKTAA